MKDPENPEKRGKMIELLEEALGFSEELNDGVTTYLIERLVGPSAAGIF